jgi:hypothetical protein
MVFLMVMRQRGRPRTPSGALRPEAHAVPPPAESGRGRRLLSEHQSPMSPTDIGTRTFCFLCDPEPEFTWLTSDSFRAVLGLGPIGEGYSLIATREHSPSMFDLDADVAAELVEFTAEVRRRLHEHYGPSVVAEHGRVSPCIAPAIRRHEPHCLHAHRLVFPGLVRVDLDGVAPWLGAEQHDSFAAARDAFVWPGQYVYVEHADGSCTVAGPRRPLPRQFLRAVVAAEQGRPELADWRRFPGRDRLAAAQRTLGLAA